MSSEFDDGAKLSLTGSLEQLALLREMTNTTGMIHEAQLFQLKHWGLLAVPEAKPKGSKVSVDIDGRLVSYDLAARRDIILNENLLDGLGRSVRSLLGSAWVVEVKLNGIRVFTDEQSLHEAEPSVRELSLEDDDEPGSGPDSG